jgi:ATP-dependent Clp protease protease subunit
MNNRRLLNLFSANAKRGTFKAAANVIELYDVIVSSEIDAEWFGGVSLPAFAKALEGMTGDVHLRINSPGGDVFAGIAMAQLIREYKGGQVVAHVDGYAASAASLLPLACAKTIMAPQSMLMIHSAWTIAMGNSEEFLDTAALLAKIDGQLAEGYAAKGSKTAAEFLALMADETWFTPQEAIDAGLCDEIASADKTEAQAKATAPAWDLSAFAHAPKPAPKPESESAAAIAAQVTAAAEAAAAESERQQRLRALQAKLVTAA